MDRDEAAAELRSIEAQEQRAIDVIDHAGQINAAIGWGVGALALAIAQCGGIRGLWGAGVFMLAGLSTVHLLSRDPPMIGKWPDFHYRTMLVAIVKGTLGLFVIYVLVPAGPLASSIEGLSQLDRWFDPLPLQIAVMQFAYANTPRQDDLAQRVFIWMVLLLGAANVIVWPHVAPYWQAPIANALIAIAYAFAALPALIRKPT